MKDRDKDRDPDKARKRAVADCRCALRKLGMLEGLEYASGEPENRKLSAVVFVDQLAKALGVRS